MEPRTERRLAERLQREAGCELSGEQREWRESGYVWEDSAREIASTAREAFLTLEQQSRQGRPPITQGAQSRRRAAVVAQDASGLILRRERESQPQEGTAETPPRIAVRAAAVAGMRCGAITRRTRQGPWHTPTHREPR